MRIRTSLCVFFVAAGVLTHHAGAQDESADYSHLPEITLSSDNLEITESCRIKPGRYEIDDADGNGVIHIRTSDVTVVFPEGEVELMGAPEGTPWDELTGIGIVIEDATNVTIRGAHCHRFKNGIVARRTDGLTLWSCDVAGGYAQRLGSTLTAEDSSDWLWPHANDDGQWLANYGAGIYVQDSKSVTIAECFARRRQNGIILDRVSGSWVYDNDCSFLSGWGLAMWRSSENVISRNAFDFCIRGYSHGNYNRGQDSAGILMFEQCHDNVIAENSATHGGDGFFAFSGREALGEDWRERERARLRRETEQENVDDLLFMDEASLEPYKQRGHKRNLLVGNDFSYAAAHGVELTFAFDNRIIANTISHNAICGIWGGYSRGTFISRNTFIGNGESGYGLERGGVNIEHGQANVIDRNIFEANACGVHLWWDEDAGFATLPWAIANGTASNGNRITRNAFRNNELDVHLREAGAVAICANEGGEPTLKVEGEAQIIDRFRHSVREDEMPEYPVFGSKTPVGARGSLAGRENIVMGEWFPWDHREPLLRLIADTGQMHSWETRGVSMPRPEGSYDGYRVSVGQDFPGQSEIRVVATRPGAVEYNVRLLTGDDEEEMRIEGTVVRTDWEVRCFAWDPATQDPRIELEAWRALGGEEALVSNEAALRFAFGSEGPASQLRAARGRQAEAWEGMGKDHFGVVARTTMPLTAGRWKVTTRSDDGVRVSVTGAHTADQSPIENWTWHGPTTDTGIFEVDESGDVTITVEYFEIDGHAILEFSLSPVR